MKNIFAVILALVTSVAAVAEHHHARHNMLLYGSEEIYAYHIVYKVPHNYQVILRVHFDEKVMQDYVSALKNYPDNTFILLLNHMDIGQISKMETISGTLLRKDSSEKQTIIIPNVILEKDDFKVVFFDELPLDLSSKPSLHGSLPEDTKTSDANFSESRASDCKIVYHYDMKCLWCGGSKPVWCKDWPWNAVSGDHDNHSTTTNTGSSCSAACGPLSMAYDRCRVTCPPRKKAVCSKSGSGLSCTAHCSCEDPHRL